MFIDQFLYDDWCEHQDAFSPDFDLMHELTSIMADRMAWLPLPKAPGYSNLTVRVARFCPFGPCWVVIIPRRFGRYPTLRMTDGTQVDQHPHQ